MKSRLPDSMLSRIGGAALAIRTRNPAAPALITASAPAGFRPTSRENRNVVTRARSAAGITPLPIRGPLPVHEQGTRGDGRTQYQAEECGSAPPETEGEPTRLQGDCSTANQQGEGREAGEDVAG